MSTSRVSQLLKSSRSRHQIVPNQQLKRAFVDYQIQKKKSRETNEELRKMVSEMKYFQSLNRRLDKGLVHKKKQLNEVKSIRERYSNDQKRKQHIEQLKQQQIRKNKDLSDRIKQQRGNRRNSVRRNIFQKHSLGDHYRSEKERLREERDTLYNQQLNKNRARVQTIVEFQCNLRESFIRKKQDHNNLFLKLYKKSIQENRRTIDLNRHQTDTVKQKLRTLTQGTARRMDQLRQLSNLIKRYKPTIPSHSPLSFNKQKLISKSRCYTDTKSENDRSNTQDISLLMSEKKHNSNL